MVQQPLDLGAGKIGIKQQAGARGDHALLSGSLQPGADIGGAAVLPDDGGMDRLAGRTVPDQGRFPLVGDADGRDATGPDPGPFDRGAGGGGGGGP